MLCTSRAKRKARLRHGILKEIVGTGKVHVIVWEKRMVCVEGVEPQNDTGNFVGRLGSEHGWVTC